MRYSTLIGCIALAGVSFGTTATASQKPCRSADGKVIATPKQAKTASPRCKDEKGRFVASKPKPAPAPK